MIGPLKFGNASRQKNQKLNSIVKNHSKGMTYLRLMKKKTLIRKPALGFLQIKVFQHFLGDLMSHLMEISFCSLQESGIKTHKVELNIVRFFIAKMSSINQHLFYQHITNLLLFVNFVQSCLGKRIQSQESSLNLTIWSLR